MDEWDAPELLGWERHHAPLLTIAHADRAAEAILLRWPALHLVVVSSCVGHVCRERLRAAPPAHGRHPHSHPRAAIEPSGAFAAPFKTPPATGGPSIAISQSVDGDLGSPPRRIANSPPHIASIVRASSWESWASSAWAVGSHHGLLSADNLAQPLDLVAQARRRPPARTRPRRAVP